MINFAWDGITSFSIKPIRFILSTGIIIMIISFITLLVLILLNINNLSNISFASIICVISFFSSVQMICIGIIGEYVGKTYIESKHRPRYVIEGQTINEK